MQEYNTRAIDQHKSVCNKRQNDGINSNAFSMAVALLCALVHSYRILILSKQMGGNNKDVLNTLLLSLTILDENQNNASSYGW